MNKIWPYLTVAFFSIAIGLAIGVKWLSGGSIVINIDKIKNKRTSGSNTVTIPVEIKTPEKSKKKGLFRRIRERRKEKKN